MIPRKWSVLMAVAVVFWLVIPADAGFFMVDQNGETTLISKGRIKNASEGIVWILNGPRDEMIFINDDQKTYSIGTTDEYCNSLSAMFEQMMKGVPEEQRKMMTKGKGSSRQDVSIVKLGDGGTIAGYKTVKYKVLVGGELFKEIWLTLDSSLMKEYKPLIPVLKKFNSCTNSMEMESSPENTPEYQKLWEAGFELKSVRYERGDSESETDVVQLDKKTIPESEFKVPSGYKQVSFAELLKAQME
ncbi:MAG: DUF4412 domain-containing protein [Desulfobacteraceae bacterium]|nr:DUF4412 domain-containing protein [Desulfobacteraceae bacterium]